MTDADTHSDDWYSNDRATFGDRLAGAREAVGLSQEDLAQRLGVGVKTVERWEDDIREPRANRLQMLSGLLNVSMRWLMTGEGEGIAPTDTDVTEDVAAVLLELRSARAAAHALAERIGRLEKRLRMVAGG